MAGTIEGKAREEHFPYRISFQYSRAVPEGPMPFHYHRINEIYYCQSRGVRYLVGNRFYSLEPGDILILNSFDIHHSLPVQGEPYERSLILFPSEVVRPRSDGETDLLTCFRNHAAGYNHQRSLSPDGRRFFEELHRRGRKAMGVKRFGSDVELRLILEEALLFVNRLYLRRDEEAADRVPIRPWEKGDLARVSDIMEYIDKNISGNLSLDRLARKFGTTPNGLNRTFKRVGDFTVHQYIVNRRIQYAQLFLSEGRQVTAVAYDVGYNDLAHFIRIFKEKTGMTPGKYGRRGKS